MVVASREVQGLNSSGNGTRTKTKQRGRFSMSNCKVGSLIILVELERVDTLSSSSFTDLGSLIGNTQCGNFMI